MIKNTNREFIFMNARILIAAMFERCPYNWASSWDYGTYHIATSEGSGGQSLRCSRTWSMEVDEGSNQKSDI